MISKKFTISAVVAIAALAVIIVSLNASSEPGQYDLFAQCLTESGAKMYGAYWCPHCQKQKKAFGSSWDYIEYIECSLPNAAGQTEECRAAGITGYPTWQFRDGSRISGEITMLELSQKTGCALPTA